MKLEREHEAEARRADARRKTADLEAARQQRDAVRRDLFALFGERDPHRRGRGLEAVLNRLFEVEGLGVRESFALRSEDGVVTEQIDGAIELDHDLFIVEMKWQQGPVDVDQVARHLVRLFQRADCGAIMIASNGFTDPAINECRQALNHRTIVLLGLDELVRALEDETPITALLQERIRRARLDRQPIGARRRENQPH